VEETKANLGPYLDLYQVHSATLDSGVLANARVHEALHRICRVENGWAIGLSVSGQNQDEVIREALKLRVPIPKDDDDDGGNNGDDDDAEGADAGRRGTASPSRQRLFDSVQCTYNVLEQRPAEALLEARASGVDVIVKEALANGRALRHPTLLELSRALDCGPDQLALGAVLSQPFRPRVLSGAASAEQLRSNFGALHLRRSADDAEGVVRSTEETPCRSGAERILTSTKEGQDSLRRLMIECRMDSEKYWMDRSDLRWN
jgi:aryl-alcohol dehydrogenase-like predicted oxidoreductase